MTALPNVRPLRRAILPASAALALGVAGLISAGAATAATPAVTLTLNAPASVLNTGAAGSPFSLTVGNADTDAVTVPGSLTLSAIAPAGVSCTNIKLAPVAVDGSVGPATSPFVSGTGTCTSAPLAYTAPTGTTTYNYELYVNATGAASTTGTITTQYTFTPTTTTGNSSPVASNIGTTALVNQTAAVFGTPSSAVVHQAYSSTLVTTLPDPDGVYTVYSSTKDPSTGVYGPATAVAETPTTTTTPAHYALLDGFSFFPQTGLITRSAADAANTDDQPQTAYTVVNANGTDGAGAPANVAAQPGTTTTPARPAIVKGSVASDSFSIPTLFSDVPADSTFATQIYGLADENVINGYFDGTFRPTTTVSRQAFAHFVVAILDDGTTANQGACTTADPSAFSDVPNSSVFCQEIKFLANSGIVNGYAGGTFHPAAVISRQAIAAFVYRLHVYQASGNMAVPPGSDAECTTAPFSDVPTSNVFCGDIAYLKSSGLSTGYSDGTYHPLSGSSRQATAAFLYRYTNPAS